MVTFKKNKYFALLLALLLFFMVTPFVLNSHLSGYIFGVLFSITLYVGVYVITQNRFLIITGIVLATLVFFGFWINNFFVSDRHLMGIEYALMTVYFVMIALVVLHSVYKDKIVNFNTICGAVCGYLLLGLVWSLIYGMIYYFQTGAFNFSHTQHTFFDSEFRKFSYYSFVTLTTLGYGDIVPISPIARTFAWLEAVVGQVYLTVWIAQLIGLHVSRRYKRENSSD